MKTKLITGLSILMVLSSLGCVAVSEYLTPADIDQRAVCYASKAGTADPNDFAGYGNLYKATMLAWAIEDAHQLNQHQLMQLLDDDNLAYAQHSDSVHQRLTSARESEELLFGEKGLLTMGLGLAGFGSLTGLIGLMRKRPQDITPEELGQLMAGKNGQLTEKEQQIIELVKGVQKFIELNPNNVAKLKSMLADAQSANTKKLVASIKATL